MHRSSFSPSTSRLPSPDSFTMRMNSYAVAAGAAGVSMLAFVQPAVAEIVFTPSEANLPLNQYISIDLNHDGLPDVRFLLNSHIYHTFLGDLTVKGDGGIVGMVEEFGVRSAAPLLSGATIGPDQQFAKVNLRMATSHGADIPSYYIYSRTEKGAWGNLQNHFLGVRFVIDGTVHYGWIRMTVGSSSRPLWATITGYAYETEPDQPIKAGERSGEAKAGTSSSSASVGSLGALALGSSGPKFLQAANPVTRNDN
jgi:hypothetical protein